MKYKYATTFGGTINQANMTWEASGVERGEEPCETRAWIRASERAQRSEGSA